jgi:hypothetical protein
MPAKSKAQQRLFQAAEHGATFPMAEKLRDSMSHDKLREFAVGSEARKPEHAPKMRTQRTGYVEMTHHGNPGRKPSMRHGSY